MFEYLNNWLTSIQRDYGVNPVIFAVLYLVGVIPFWISIYRIIAGVKKGDFGQVRTFAFILGIVIIAPFLYVALFGHNLPFWFWGIAAGIIVYSIYRVIRMIKSRKEQRPV
jgi:hypothetical protein